MEEAQLGSVDGNVVYVGLPEGGRQPNDKRYPILVVGPGFAGLLDVGLDADPGPRLHRRRGADRAR